MNQFYSNTYFKIMYKDAKNKEKAKTFKEAILIYREKYKPLEKKSFA